LTHIGIELSERKRSFKLKEVEGSSQESKHRAEDRLSENGGVITPVERARERRVCIKVPGEEKVRRARGHRVVSVRSGVRVRLCKITL